jgi:L-seryl-tRNA(Ser) seleniumtransferase
MEYATGRAAETIPVIRMLTLSPHDIDARARRLGDRLEASGLYRTEIVDGQSTIGGGTTPGLTLATRLLAIERTGLSADALEAAMRRLDPPVIARIENGRVVLDLRTVFDTQDEALARLLRGVA